MRLGGRERRNDSSLFDRFDRSKKKNCMGDLRIGSGNRSDRTGRFVLSATTNKKRARRPACDLRFSDEATYLLASSA
jgi:hypothetical protein